MKRQRSNGPFVVPAGQQVVMTLRAGPGEDVPTRVDFYTGGQNILVEDIMSARWSQFAMAGAVSTELFGGLPLWLRNLHGHEEICVYLRNPCEVDVPVTLYVDFASVPVKAQRSTYLCPFQPSPESTPGQKLFIARTRVGGRLRELRMTIDCMRHLGRELKVAVSTYNTKPDETGELDGTRDLYSLKASLNSNMFGASALVRTDAVIELAIDDDEFWRDVRPEDFMIVIEHDRQA